MLNMSMMKLAAVALIGFFGVTAGGCGGASLKMVDIAVTPDASLKDSASGRLPQVEVALVGVKESDAALWREAKVDNFFSGNDAMRADAREYTKTLTFSSDNPGTQVLKANDPIFKVWKERGVTMLFVFANSRNLKTSPGAPEMRRKELPLTSDRWKTDRIEIYIKSSGIDVPTPMERAK